MVVKQSFQSFGFHHHLISCLEIQELEKPTPVQSHAFGPILNGSDVLVKSETGSGKTLAYVLPLIQQLQAVQPRISRNDGTYALIVLPTREVRFLIMCLGWVERQRARIHLMAWHNLAEQTLAVISQFVRSFVWLVPGCVSGGEKPKSEKARLRKGVTILLSTPGRLVYHIQNTCCLDFSKIQCVVVDEADRMLELGFSKSLGEIFEKVRGQSSSFQTILLSATLSSGVSKLAGVALRNPTIVDTSHLSSSAVVEVERTDGDVSSSNFVLPAKLKQFYAVVSTKDRLITLSAFLLHHCRFSERKTKVLVFASTQACVEFYYKMLMTILNRTDTSALQTGKVDSVMNVLKFYTLRGDMPQTDRKQVFLKFQKPGTSGILLATDVACRGLDLPDVNWVVNLSPPLSVADYVHRVGRTARIGKAGSSLLLLQPHEERYVADCLNVNNIKPEEYNLDACRGSLAVEADQAHHLHNRVRSVFEALSWLQWRFQKAAEDDSDLAMAARQAYHTYVQFYTTYPHEVRQFFDYKSLHLGHVAKSFALRETPSVIASHMAHSAHVQQLRDMKNERKRRQRLGADSSRHRRAHSFNTSEFGHAPAPSKKRRLDGTAAAAGDVDSTNFISQHFDALANGIPPPPAGGNDSGKAMVGPNHGVNFQNNRRSLSVSTPHSSTQSHFSGGATSAKSINVRRFTHEEDEGTSALNKKLAKRVQKTSSKARRNLVRRQHREQSTSSVPRRDHLAETIERAERDFAASTNPERSPKFRNGSQGPSPTGPSSIGAAARKKAKLHSSNTGGDSVRSPGLSKQSNIVTAPISRGRGRRPGDSSASFSKPQTFLSGISEFL